MKSSRDHCAGFSLVEVVLALGIAAFCLLNVVGVLVFGIQGAQTVGEQTVAVGLAMDVISDLKAAPLPTSGNSSSKSPRFGIAIPSTQTPTTIYFDNNGNPGALNAPPGAGAVYRVSVGIATSALGQRTATPARVMVTWPAGADANPAAWPQHYRGSWETMINLDRN